MGGDSSEPKVSGEGEGGEQINIRCSNSSKFSVRASLDSTVGAFKEVLAQNCDIPADQQRLIYKGRILKDDQTLTSYGLQADHTVHMVRAFAAPASTPALPAANAATASPTTAPGVTHGAQLRTLNQEDINCQSSWEVELEALLSSTSGIAGPSATTVEPYVTAAESRALAKLQELLSFSALKILQCKGLDSVGECLNNLAIDGLLSNESVVYLSTVLERTQQYFTIFERALRAEDDFKAAMVAHEAIRPELEAMKAKKERLADLDRQIVELQRQRSVVASELEKDFESNKPRLAEYAAGAKLIQQLQLDKRTRQAEVTMGEARWLELKAALEAFLPSTP